MLNKTGLAQSDNYMCTYGYQASAGYNNIYEEYL